MTEIAYADLASGASGDMLAAALAHAGGRAVEDAIRGAVSSLGLGCSVTFERASRGGLHCMVAKVQETGERHDVEALRAAIERAEVGDGARRLASGALEAIVGAEARVHGTAPDDVHLHDLGSADTAADLIGVAAGLEALGVERLAAAPVPAPRGWVASAHGALPLPAPATLELLRGVPMYGVDVETELVTPTAAALLVAAHASFGPMPPMVVREVGVGGGTRDLARPNVCRVILGTSVAAAGGAYPGGLTIERDVVLETNIDDQAPESLGPALEALLRAGAKDAWITPIVMKKSRPAFQLSVLVSSDGEAAVLDVLFRETTTLGARRRETEKWVVDREVLHVPVRGTNVRVKVGRLGGEVVTVSPEFDDCLTVATRAGVSLLEIQAEVLEKARRTLSG